MTHSDRCASLLGQGCDCRDPWDALGPPRERGVRGVVGEHDSPGVTERVCPTKVPERHLLGEFPMTCYRCHVEADS